MGIAHVVWTFAILLMSLLSIVCCDTNGNNDEPSSSSSSRWNMKNVFLVKVGGSSITDKATRETLNPQSLTWLAETLSLALDSYFRFPPDKEESECKAATADPALQNNKHAFILVHGAGSFGHFTAKEYGLAGQSSTTDNATTTTTISTLSNSERERFMQGLAKTRLSVQTLNLHVISTLIAHGIPAIGMSPCFWNDHDSSQQSAILQDFLQAGLVPVIHGDACLDHSNKEQQRQQRQLPHIVGGDTIMEILGRESWIGKTIFLTDVDGVFTADPRLDPEAKLLSLIEINGTTGRVMTDVEASGSSHDHDVTGGLETKLGAAASIAMSGKDVIIVKCGSTSAERAIRGEPHGRGTRIRKFQNTTTS